MNTCPKCGSTKIYVSLFGKIECPTRSCVNFTEKQFMSTIEVSVHKTDLSEPVADLPDGPEIPSLLWLRPNGDQFIEWYAGQHYTIETDSRMDGTYTNSNGVTTPTAMIAGHPAQWGGHGSRNRRWEYTAKVDTGIHTQLKSKVGQPGDWGSILTPGKKLIVQEMGRYIPRLTTGVRHSCTDNRPAMEVLVDGSALVRRHKGTIVRVNAPNGIKGVDGKGTPLRLTSLMTGSYPAAVDPALSFSLHGTEEPTPLRVRIHPVGADPDHDEALFDYEFRLDEEKNLTILPTN